jgi:hypothetical protein
MCPRNRRLRVRDRKLARIGHEEFRRREIRLHQPRRGVCLCRKQVVADLMRKRTPHCAAKICVPLESRHPGHQPDDASRRLEESHRVVIRQVEPRLRLAIVELNPSKRRIRTVDAAALMADDDVERGLRRAVRHDARLTHQRHTGLIPDRVGLADNMIDECRRNVRRGGDGDDERGTRRDKQHLVP